MSHTSPALRIKFVVVYVTLSNKIPVINGNWVTYDIKVTSNKDYDRI